MTKCELNEIEVEGICQPIKKIGRLNPYWNKKLRAFALQYKHPFGDVDRIIINTNTGELSVVERSVENMVKRFKNERGYTVVPSRVKDYWDIMDKRGRIIEEGYLSKKEAEYITEQYNSGKKIAPTEWRPTAKELREL